MKPNASPITDAQRTRPVPPWLVDEATIVEAQDRHSWMCRQLKERRQRQFRNASTESYGHVLSQLFDTSPASVTQTEHIFEVLSDGLGYIQPNWHALEVTPGRTEIITQNAQAKFNDRIASHREQLSVGTRTQRAVGKLLYESALFAISNSGIWLLSTAPPSEQWVYLNTGDNGPLPIKTDTGMSRSLHTLDPVTSLSAITQKALWPSFFVDAKPCECLSLVLLHTSLWHEGAGVWAFHARFRGAEQIRPKKSVLLSELRSLVAPAVCCLEDVSGWAYQREGLHAQRRLNVNFLYHALGVLVPEWDQDGIVGSADVDRERDFSVYDLPADAAPSVTTRLILQIARGGSSCGCEKWKLVETGFTAARLICLNRLQAQVIPDEPAPSTIYLYVEHLLRRMGRSDEFAGAVDAAIMLDRGIRYLGGMQSLCETCRSFADNLTRYWGLVQADKALG
jgi:hypothetical protein